MWKQIFDPDNLFWRLISRGVDFVGLSLMWLVLSLPIFTMGSATAACYYTVVKALRQGEEDAYSMYWREFKRDLKKGIPVTLIFLLALVVIYLGYSIMREHANSDFGLVMFVAYYVVLLIPLGMFAWIFPILGRFEMSLKQLFYTSFVLSISHLKSTVVIVLLATELVIFTIERWWPVFFTPVLGMLLISLFLERIFPKYLSEDELAKFQNKPSENEPHHPA